MHLVEATTAGVGRHVLDLGTIMHQAGHEVLVVCPQKRGGALDDTAFAGRVAAAGVRVLPLDMQRAIRPLADLRALIALLRILRRERPDVLHAHSSKAGVLARLTAWPARVSAVVYTPNAFAFLGERPGPVRSLYRWAEQLLGRTRTDALICVSRSEFELARRNRLAPPDRLVLIENAIDAGEFEPTLDARRARVRLGMDPDRPLVGFVGRLAPQKGLETLIRAAQITKQSGVEARFFAGGRGRAGESPARFDS